MAKSNWGITSGFIGKLGNVVGYNWKGINVQRAHIVNNSKSRSEEQQLARARFALVTLAGSDLYEALYVGYRHHHHELHGQRTLVLLTPAANGKRPPESFWGRFIPFLWNYNPFIFTSFKYFSYLCSLKRGKNRLYIYLSILFSIPYND